jgi:hypothetical protein
MKKHDGGIPGLIQKAADAVVDPIVDQALEILLAYMKHKIDTDKEYAKLVAGFNGVVVVRTGIKGERIAASAIFADGKMCVDKEEAKPWDVRVTFADHHALLKFAKSGGGDVLDLALENSAQVQGNYNYFYRFGFLARELLRQSALSQFWSLIS